MPLRLLQLIVLLTSCLLPVHAAPPASGANVPGADVMIFIDYASLRASPFWQTYVQLDTKEKGRRKSGRQEGDGLTWDDMQRLTATLDLDPVDFSKIEESVQFLKLLHLVISVELDQSLSPEQLRNAIKSEMSEQVGGKAQFVEKDENLLLVLARDPDLKEDYPIFFGRAASGRELLMGSNEKFLRDAMRRADDGKFEPLRPELAKLVADPSQVQIAVVLPESVRTALGEVVDELDRAQAKAGGLQLGPILAPLRGLKSVVLRLHCKDQDATVLGEAEFTTPELAAQAAMMANLMLAPSLAQRLTADKAKPATFKATALANRATLEGKLTRRQLESKPKPRPDNTI